jgi:hypothetical protein
MHRAGPKPGARESAPAAAGARGGGVFTDGRVWRAAGAGRRPRRRRGQKLAERRGRGAGRGARRRRAQGFAGGLGSARHRAAHKIPGPAGALGACNSGGIREREGETRWGARARSRGARGPFDAPKTHPARAAPRRARHTARGRACGRGARGAAAEAGERGGLRVAVAAGEWGRARMGTQGARCVENPQSFGGGGRAARQAAVGTRAVGRRAGAAGPRGRGAAGAQLLLSEEPSLPRRSARTNASSTADSSSTLEGGGAGKQAQAGVRRAPSGGAGGARGWRVEAAHAARARVACCARAGASCRARRRQLPLRPAGPHLRCAEVAGDRPHQRLARRRPRRRPAGLGQRDFVGPLVAEQAGEAEVGDERRARRGAGRGAAERGRRGAAHRAPGRGCGLERRRGLGRERRGALLVLARLPRGAALERALREAPHRRLLALRLLRGRRLTAAYGWRPAHGRTGGMTGRGGGRRPPACARRLSAARRGGRGRARACARAARAPGPPTARAPARRAGAGGPRAPRRAGPRPRAGARRVAGRQIPAGRGAIRRPHWPRCGARDVALDAGVPPRGASRPPPSQATGAPGLRRGSSSCFDPPRPRMEPLEGERYQAKRAGDGAAAGFEGVRISFGTPRDTRAPGRGEPGHMFLRPVPHPTRRATSA